MRGSRSSLYFIGRCFNNIVRSDFLDFIICVNKFCYKFLFDFCSKAEFVISITIKLSFLTSHETISAECILKCDMWHHMLNFQKLLLVEFLNLVLVFLSDSFDGLFVCLSVTVQMSLGSSRPPFSFCIVKKTSYWSSSVCNVTLPFNQLIGIIKVFIYSIKPSHPLTQIQ